MIKSSKYEVIFIFFIRGSATILFSGGGGAVFQRQLSIIDFTLNYPPIRNNLTSASLLSMLIETDYLNYPPIRNNLTSASLLSLLIETDYNFKKIIAVFFGSCLKEFYSVWNCLFI